MQMLQYNVIPNQFQLPAKAYKKLVQSNINGFKNSKEFLHSRCQDETHAIFAIQEHWLKPPVRKQQGLNLLKSLHKDYDSRE